MSVLSKLLIICATATATVTALYMSGYLKRKQDSKPELFFETIFFPDSIVDECGDMPRKFKELQYKDLLIRSISLSRVKDRIMSAKNSLDICMYHFTSYDLAKAVVEKKKKGVKVRVLCDWDCEAGSGSQIKKLYEAGIAVRTKQMQYIMHHKFTIIDDEVLMTGSFNWTMTASMGNFENVIATNHPETVRDFKSEFERLWTLYDFEKH